MTPSNSTNPSSSQFSNPSHRSLGDDVLQSAGEAVSSEGADDYAGLSRGDYVARSGVQSPYTGRVSSAGMGDTEQLLGDSGPGFFSRTQDRLTRYVASEPTKAAMMAAGAGALLMILMGRRGRGGRR